MSSDGSPKAKSKSTYHFVAGLGSGMLSAVLLQPIDLLKTRVQQSGHHSLTAALREIRNSPRILPALWRGATPSALRTGFGSAIYFTSLNAIRTNVSRIPFLAADTGTGDSALSTIRDRVKAGAGHSHSSSLVKLSNTGNLLAGAVARTFAGMILMPLTVIKVRYESNLYSYGSISAAGRDILAKEGAKGFFSGFGATAMRDAPYAGLYVLFYEQSKKRLSAWHGANDNSHSAESRGHGRMGVSTAATINFSSGVIAGGACSAISNPFDAVKTRIQLQPGVYRNMFHAAHMMATQEGMRSFLDGLALRMGRKALSSALAWTVYEELVRRAEVTLNPTKRRENVL
ncbi:mitochondrial carrier [Cryphonectria parasitica EP155]|uniref:Mitochondrial glycine transporter n=1 Tax=Cryphonectria parasitica (strain ATCC 38755 / EP155) TaxID=660469 RepID=A0A9P4Y1I2_CRYP1|nr:mitochondrial carrier [Cryphonectria parasitica EP155]KAF3764866.1 mitochondrial carrier [Cryphonectria parasitica EP155]